MISLFVCFLFVFFFLFSICFMCFFFFFSSRRRHTRYIGDWSSDVCSSDLKLGVISSSYKIDFYGPETSSVLHRNGTDRLWVTWPMTSRRVRDRLEGKKNRPELLDLLSNLMPLIQFNGDGKPVRTDLAAALSRQRIAIEIPSDIISVERKDPGLAREWRVETRWAFTEALKAGFFVAEFCRMVRGKQGPGVYLLEKGSVEEYVPEMARSAPPSAR